VYLGPRPCNRAAGTDSDLPQPLVAETHPKRATFLVETGSTSGSRSAREVFLQARCVAIARSESRRPNCKQAHEQVRSLSPRKCRAGQTLPVASCLRNRALQGRGDTRPRATSRQRRPGCRADTPSPSVSTKWALISRQRRRGCRADTPSPSVSTKWALTSRQRRRGAELPLPRRRSRRSGR